MEKRQLETEKEQQTTLLHGKKRQIPTIFYTIALLIVVGFLFSLGNANFISAYNLNTIASFGLHSAHGWTGTNVRDPRRWY